ncbi:MAG TPA: Ppx/GppA phosphatase family protein [Blastocatellia bacterium]|nr:Ppx/GppA phosphatase family protein [Blastocatellia bacterium]
MKLSAIDIGSNSIHLVIAQATPGQHLEIIEREKEMVRLGAGTLRLHRLSKETIDRAVVTLRRYKELSESNHVDRMLATATAAVREAHNSDEFIDRVRKEVGLHVHVLPGVEEARLIALAVSEVTDFESKRALIVDIGGGSTDFIITGGKEPDLLLSIRLGAVRLTEKFVSTDPISEREREKLVTNIRADLTRAVWEIKRTGFDFVLGTSGTVVNLVSAVARAELGRDDEGMLVEPFNQTISLDQLREMNEMLARMPLGERKKVPGLEKRRADIIVAGGLLLESVLLEVGASTITSCDWSLREGVILDFLYKHPEAVNDANSSAEMTTAEPEYPLLPDPDRALDVRTRSVLSVARRYDYDPSHSHFVARVATQIFDRTKPLHGMGDQERKLLEYAAILHDIGYHIAHNNHHRHSLYLIKNSEMPGFSGTEIGVMAGIARYHRGSMPGRGRDAIARREHEDYRALDRQSKKAVLKLAAILRIADGLDRSYKQRIENVDCTLSDSGVTFLVTSNEPCDLEIWSADRKAEWFRQLFEVPVKFVGKHSAQEASSAAISAVPHLS